MTRVSVPPETPGAPLKLPAQSLLPRTATEGASAVSHPLLLPAATALEPSMSATPITHQHLSGGLVSPTSLLGRRVLLLHRQPMALNLLSRMLSDCGVEVTAVSTVADMDAHTAGPQMQAFWMLVVDLPTLLLDPSSQATSPTAGRPVESSDGSSSTVLSRLHRTCQTAGLVLMLFIPLGSQRRHIVEHADAVLTHPIKPTQLQTVMLSLLQGWKRNISAIESPAKLDKPVPSLPTAPPSSPLDAGSLTPLETDPSTPDLTAGDLLGLNTPRLQTPAPQPTAAQYFAFASTHPLKVLIAEDNSVNQRIVSKMLTRLGFLPSDFRLTADGQSAAEEVQRCNTIGSSTYAPYQVVLMDIQMRTGTLRLACEVAVERTASVDFVAHPFFS
jgi:CheY-like chemotaxis protein